MKHLKQIVLFEHIFSLCIEITQLSKLYSFLKVLRESLSLIVVGMIPIIFSS